MPPSNASCSDAFDVSQHVGLVNLGNTCFFNSVLQAASATRPLHSLFHPWGDLALPEAATNSGLITASLGSRPVNRRKIPALLLTDEEAKRPIIPALMEQQSDQLFHLLPLSNSFRFTLEKTWRYSGSDPNVRIASHSPKVLLKLLAKKFDQFGQYKQQDAHELLRLLLDAMRMEELDFIKSMRPRERQQAQRQPSHSSLSSTSSSDASRAVNRPKEDATENGHLTATNISASTTASEYNGGNATPHASEPRHYTTSEGESTLQEQRPRQSSSSYSAISEYDPAWEGLTSLIDVLWGGKLASMVVCEGCRHVSHTYEDFLDLSLPLRPEDAASASLRDKPANRVRLMADRWRKQATPVGSTRSWKAASINGEKETIFKQTLQCHEGPDELGSMVEGSQRLRRAASSQFVDEHISADENSMTPGSNSWSAWASTLSRSRSARPTTSALLKPAMPGQSTERDANDLPDIASMALTPEPSASCSSTRNEETLKQELTATLEAKSRGSRDLLSALSNASRANSRAGSRNRESVPSRNASPGVERSSTPKFEAIDAEQSHSHHLTGLLHNLHHAAQKPRREPSRQAQYIARVFGEPGFASSLTNLPTPSNSTRSTFRSKVRTDQAGTGLAIALRAFTTSEVLSEENSFNCKRCWRRLNPAKGAERERLRRRRETRGKNPSGSEDSEDDDGMEAGEDEIRDTTRGTLTSSATLKPSLPPRLVAPKPQRAVHSLLDSLSAASSEDEASCAEAIINSDISVADGHLDTPSVSVLDALDVGAKTPVSRIGSTQPQDSQPLPLSPQTSIGPQPQTVDSTKIRYMEQQGLADTDKNNGDDADTPAAVVPRLLGGSALPSHSSHDAIENCPTEAYRQQRSVSRGSNASGDHQSVVRGTFESTSTYIMSTIDQNLCVSGDESDASHGRTDGEITSARGSNEAARHLDTQTTGVLAQPAKHVGMPPPPGRLSQRQLKRSTQSIPRRALKRYLISEFPPILVFHLKRFQINAAARSPTFFGSSGNQSFKKIDDVVTFPEWLDMAEWMAPPREEYDRNGKMKETSDPRVWEAYQKQARETMSVPAAISITANQERPSSAQHLSNNSTGLKRKPSRWPRPFSRGTSSPSSSNSSLPATANGSVLTPTPPPPHSRVASPTLAHNGFHSHHTETAAAKQETRVRDSPTPLYRLYSVVAHHGATMHGGHYTSYVLSDRCNLSVTTKGKDGKQTSTTKDAAAGGAIESDRPSIDDEPSRPHQATDEQRQWVYCSDSVIKPATLDQVLKCKDAYMVWYERVT